ncbi:MAG TPA: outer membrane lipoprotein carrier protein LolA [Trueperaceae bacterium]|nr:outer membrane lipoprotein carrier protein LolA [Trueperaceae bacterium]
MRALAPLTRLAAASALLLAGLASAQEAPPVETILDNVTQAARDLQDASFLLTGRVVDADGTEFPLEIEVQVVPGLDLAKAYIVQPDALADNQIVLDGAAVYSYSFLTHQVTVFDADDPDALGGMLPAGQDGATANLSLDLGEILAGYEAELVGVEEGPEGSLYRLAFANRDREAMILDVHAWVLAADWLPRRLVFKEAGGRVVAELNAEQLAIDQGLDPEEVRALPEDAEVIDNRRR